MDTALLYSHRAAAMAGALAEHTLYRWSQLQVGR